MKLKPVIQLKPPIQLPRIGVARNVVSLWREQARRLVTELQGVQGVPDGEFDEAFLRSSGWTGADGTYSLPLHDGRTLWLFSDTLVGKVDEAGRRTLDSRVPVNAGGHQFINNSLAIQAGPDPSNIRFITGWQRGAPTNLFDAPSAESWFWVNGAICNPDSTVTVLLNEFATAEGELAPFGRHIGLWTATLQLDGDEVQVLGYRRNRAVAAIDSDGATTVWGATILEQGPWTYIYGSHVPADSDGNRRGLLIARTARGKLDDDRAWRFFDGSEFVEDSRQAAPQSLPVPNEFSIQPIFGSRYLMTFADGYGPISLSFAASPTGPWTEAQPVWTPPEATDTVYSYNPKAHPAQSDERGLLISYNVNSFDVDEALVEADIYRPRFIRVPWRNIERMARRAHIPEVVLQMAS